VSLIRKTGEIFALSNVPKLYRTFFRASELPKCSFMLGPQSAIFAIARLGRSNLCPSHYSLNSLSEFDGLIVGQFPVTRT
jgi:hypothetical protein